MSVEGWFSLQVARVSVFEQASTMIPSPKARKLIIRGSSKLNATL